MTHSLAFLLLAHMAISADAPKPVFAFAADSLTATVTRLGGKAPADGDSLLTSLPCDSAAADPAVSGPVAWFEVEVADKRAGTDVRFPMDETELRRGLRSLCDDGSPSPAHVAAVLRATAARLRVRMGGPEAGNAE